MEPAVDGHDQIRRSHPGTLRKVAKLVRQHSRQLPCRQAGCQRHADRQNQVAAEKAEQPTSKAGRGIDFAVDVDPSRLWRMDGGTQLIDEFKQQRFSITRQ